METINRLRKLGSVIFILMWVPFTCIFVSEFAATSSWGRALAARVPILLEPGVDGWPLVTEVSIVATFVMMFAAMGLTFGAPLMASILSRRIRRTGELARASILAVEQTGTYINQNPVLRFTLEVMPTTGSAFQANTEKLVNLVDIPRYQPGQTIAVRYDPNTLETAISDESPPAG